MKMALWTLVLLVTVHLVYNYTHIPAVFKRLDGAVTTQQWLNLDKDTQKTRNENLIVA